MQQHPQVLHRRAHARIVQVHKVRPCFGHAFRRPQNIAGVAVAVQAQHVYLLGHTRLHHFKRLVAKAQPLLRHFRCNPTVAHQ